MDSVFSVANLKEWGSTGFVAFIIFLMLTDQLILKPRLRAAERERDRWMNIALDLLGVAKDMTEANETAVKAIDKLPTPEIVTEVVKKVTRSDKQSGEAS